MDSVNDTMPTVLDEEYSAWDDLAETARLCEERSVEITVRSWLNFDGYQCEGHGYKLDQIAELKEVVGDREIVWLKGKNTFTGNIVGDRFMEQMKERYYND